MEAMLEDDAALLSALDALDAGSASHMPVESVGEPSADELGSFIGAANAALQDSADSVPTLSPDARNIASVLRAALRAIPRLADAMRANSALRRAAENDAQRASTAMATAQRALADERRRAAANARADAEALGRAQAAVTRERSLRTRAVADAADARADVMRGAQRAGAAAALAKRRERELTRLQARVHALLGGTRRPRLIGEVRGGGDGEKSSGDGAGRTYAMLAADAVRARADAADRENEQLRGAVRAVHAELDALLDTFPHVLQLEREQQALLHGPEKEFEAPVGALSDERMLLPYALIEAEIDDAVVTKFKLLRRALCLDALDAADYHESGTDAEVADVENGVDGESSEGDKNLEEGVEEEVDENGGVEQADGLDKGDVEDDDEAGEQVECVNTVVSIAASSKEKQVGEESGTEDGTENKMGEANGVSLAAEYKETR